MSIASEITRLQNDKTAILNALTAQGVTVPADASFDDVATLISSISGGGGLSSFYSGAYTPTGDSVCPDFDIGSSNFSHFLIYPTTDPRNVSSNKCFLFAYTSFGAVDEVTLSSQNTGSAIVNGYMQYKWFEKC